VGDAEVDQLPAAVAAAHQVGRLDVAVEDAAGVGGLEGAGDLDAEGRDLGRRQGAAGRQELAQARPGQELHHQVRLAVVDAQVEDRDHPGVSQGRQRARLGLEAGVEDRRRHAVEVADALDRDLAAEPIVVGPHDRAHRAGADRGPDAVAADHRAGLGHVTPRRGPARGR
jgi:hypothetical protein